MYVIYSVLIVAFFLLMSPSLIYQAVRHRKYIGSLTQRLGYLPISFNLDSDESIWIHAVSVGEVLTARALLPDLRERYPKLRLFLSTTTMTGQQIARNNLQYVDGVFYFPFDLGFIVNRTVKLVNPTALHHDGDRDLAEPAPRVPPRGREDDARQRPNFVPVVSALSHRPLVLPSRAPPHRSLLHAERRVGAAGRRHRRRARSCDRHRIAEVRLARDSWQRRRGSGTESRPSLLQGGADRPVLIAASTVRTEEEPVLEAFHRIRATMTNALLIIAPRKPERFDDVEKLARRAGWNVARRSELRVDADPRHDVVILDTIGELAQLYQIATVVFVGGSLVDMGGHNILEPAVFGKPIVFGPYMQNFAEISRTFLDNAAAVQVHSDRELESALLELLGDPVRRARLGAAARALVEANRGAREKTLATIAQVLDPMNVVRPFRRV